MRVRREHFAIRTRAHRFSRHRGGRTVRIGIYPNSERHVGDNTDAEKYGEPTACGLAIEFRHSAKAEILAMHALQPEECGARRIEFDAGNLGNKREFALLWHSVRAVKRDR